jgi:uncharacterized membrane protein YfcA
MIELFTYQLDYPEFALLMVVGMLIGMAKTGVSATGMAAVPLLAIVFGGKASTGLLLPILCFADVFAVLYYHRHAQWNHLIRLFPWAALGVLIGTWIGERIDDELFRMIMGIIVFVSLGIMLWQERTSNRKIPQGFWFAALLGILGGFTTMVGNLAGSVMALYLLTMRLPKYQFIGTAAWFFMIINWFKVPFHVVVWETITWNSFFLDLVALPAVAFGAVLGVAIVKRIPEQIYRWFIIATTAVASVIMIL